MDGGGGGTHNHETEKQDIIWWNWVYKPIEAIIQDVSWFILHSQKFNELSQTLTFAYSCFGCLPCNFNNI